MRKNNQDKINVPVSLRVNSGFTGLVVVKLDNGAEKAQFPLKSGEIFGSLDSFIEAAKIAGYQIIPPAVQG
ncbi:hypothetical protein QUR14_001045 [Enterobacter hormaechei]|nr:hypothetical protein [Enterobacter hormaechei]